MIFQNLSLSP